MGPCGSGKLEFNEIHRPRTLRRKEVDVAEIVGDGPDRDRLRWARGMLSGSGVEGASVCRHAVRFDLA